MSKKKQKTEEELDEFAVIAWVKHIGLAAGYGLLFMFLVTNILLSQVLPSFYSEIFTGNKDALVSFFKKAESSSFFPSLKSESTSLYNQFEFDITSDVRNRQTRIHELENLLNENPRSRDVLYALSILYEQDGNTFKAKEYLDKALSVDPNVGI